MREAEPRPQHLAAGVVLLVFVARGTTGGTSALAGLAPAAALLLMGLRLPGVGALSGLPLLALALAGVAILTFPGAGEASRIAQARPRVREIVFLPAVFLLYTLAAGRVQLQVRLQWR